MVTAVLERWEARGGEAVATLHEELLAPASVIGQYITHALPVIFPFVTKPQVLESEE